MAITIASVAAADCEAIAKMITAVFSAQIAPGLSPEGQEQFTSFIQPQHLRDRLAAGACMLTAHVDGELAGFLELRIYRHVALLFTSLTHQRKGIARELLAAGVTRCRHEKPCLQQITVNATAYALPVYEKLGFWRTSEEQERDGIRFTPMAFTITRQQLQETAR